MSPRAIRRSCARWSSPTRPFACATTSTTRYARWVELLAASGLSSPEELRPWHILRRVSPTEVHHYGEMYEYLRDRALLSEPVPKSFARAWNAAKASSFESATSES